MGETPGHFPWILLDISMFQQTVRKELVMNQNDDITVTFSLSDGQPAGYILLSMAVNREGMIIRSELHR